MGVASLWAITTYFNPAGYQRRRANYRTFRRHLPVPLLAVELSFAGAYQLQPEDADVLLRLECPDVLWHKERLLNLAVARLPEECSKVLWIDCDLIISHPDLPRTINASLDDVPLLQPFSRANHLSPDALPGEKPPLFSQPSLAGLVTAGGNPSDLLANVTNRTQSTPAPGLAWAARRDLLARHALYDACIVGGGDTAITCAAFGCPETVIALHAMNAHQEAYYRHWAAPFCQDVHGRVGCIDAEAHHLYHGSMASRRPRQRHIDLGPFDFDPAIDLASDPVTGCWRWNSDKPLLHAYARDYFAARNEDTVE